MYINTYNRRKKRHQEEVELLKQAFEHELLKSQMEVQEQTLKTIAYDLHDNIGQLLGLTILTLSAINMDEKEKAAEKIAAAEDLTKKSAREIRALARLLHGEELVSRGLITAIAFELEWLEKGGFFQVTYHRNIDALHSQPDKETILFRLFQETLNNIIRHAQAKEILINLALENDLLSLSIADNGIGFDVAETMKMHKGLGLQNIHKRAGMIGGHAVIDSAPGTGTRITFTIPYNHS